MVAPAYGMQVVALRLFNVFGPGQALSNPYTGVLANFGARLRNWQGPLVFEDGQQKRDFVHVRDVAGAFCLAMDRQEAAGHVINIAAVRHTQMLGSPRLWQRPWECHIYARKFWVKPVPATSAIALRISLKHTRS